jgi:hypothetical protein
MERGRGRVATIKDARLQLAAAFLLHHKEISILDIEALPIVGDRATAELLAGELMRRLGAQRYQKRVDDAELARWEDVLCLPDANPES